MTYPIIIYGDGALDVFESVEKAERFIEPIDIEIGDNILFTSEGEILKAFVEIDSRGFKRTIIMHNEEKCFNGPKLKQLLVDFLASLEYPIADLQNMELQSLVKESLKFKTD